MSNIRPWFRLSSIARPTPQGSSDPPPPPQPQPRPTPRRSVVVRPPSRQPSPPRQQQPPSPPPPRQQTPPPPPPPRQEPSPYQSPPSRHMSPPTPKKPPSPLAPPPRSSYTPPPSPKEVQEAIPQRKPTSPPSPSHSTRVTKHELESNPRRVPSPRVLSPYSLPPSQLHSEHEATQKNILTTEKTNHLHEPNHHNHHNHNHQNHEHQGNNTKKTNYHSESDYIMGTRVITISGDNKGAIMEILRSPSSNKTTGSGGEGIHSSKVLNVSGEKGRRLQSSSSSSSSDEGEGKKNRNKNGNNTNLPMKAFMNSNVQMFNNSIVYNSSATHHDPGVHLKISRKPGSGKGLHVKDYGNNGEEYTN